MSRTLILVKPDAFERGLTGEVITRFERKGLRPAAMKLMVADEEIANRHYAEHAEKPFFGELVSFITGGPLVAMVLEGNDAVVAARQLIGATNPLEAATGLDPRRLRDRGHLQPRARLRLRRVGRARDLDLVPRPLLILASASPRRREILTALGVEFEVVVPDVEEIDEGDPAEVVLENARRKASAAAGRRPKARSVLAADTEVVLDGRVLGKAADEARGAVAPRGSVGAHPHGPRRAGDQSRRAGGSAPAWRPPQVTFGELDAATLDLYLASGEWRDRAGAYAIQGLGSILIERLEGDFSNVVGLPVGLLLELAPELFE